MKVINVLGWAPRNYPKTRQLYVSFHGRARRFAESLRCNIDTRTENTMRTRSRQAIREPHIAGTCHETPEYSQHAANSYQN